MWGPSKADIAHYFRFGAILHEHQLEYVNGQWSYTGTALPFPTDIRPVAPVPLGGYPDHSKKFDCLFTDVLHKMQYAWTHGDQTSLNDAVTIMRDDMKAEAQALMDLPIVPGSPETYGPGFVFRD